MNKRQIERYFETLAKIYPKKCRIVLTGAAAGALYGNVRSTMDIDFAATTKNWEEFANAVAKTSARMAIEAQFAENIDRWSSISLMDYQKHTFIYKRFGSIELRLMEPAYWAIGKLTWYLDSDIHDMVKVFKKTHTSWNAVARVTGRALRQSPKSTTCFLFRRQNEDFFDRFGKKIWGKSFDPKKAVSLFCNTAGIKS